MNCPICGEKMLEGGLVAAAIAISWHSKEQFEKNYLGIYTDGKSLAGKSNILLGQTTVPNAYFCEKCSKVVGVFDVK